MAAHFILKTSLADLAPLQAGGRPVLEDYQKLRAGLQERGGEELASLFAEPVVTWGNGENPGSVSWYAEGTGEAVPLERMPPDRRAPFEAMLRGHLAQILPLRRDPVLGPLVTRALILSGTDGVVAVGDRVALVGWGLAPAGTLPAASAPRRHRDHQHSLLPPPLRRRSSSRPRARRSLRLGTAGLSLRLWSSPLCFSASACGLARASLRRRSLPVRPP